MSIDEIRQPCLRVQNLVERLENSVERERRRLPGLRRWQTIVFCAWL